MLFKSIFKRKKKKLLDKFKFDLNNWMDLTKEERFAMDSKEKIESMRRKKALLKSIREEYIRINKKK